MYLSELKIKNFRQFGAGEPVFSVQFHEGVTALVGENDAGKTAVIDAIRHVLLTRDMEFMRLQIVRSMRLSGRMPPGPAPGAPPGAPL